MVSIAGPCRKGKSYILSKAFDQGEVFPLGHFLDPETMGIWLWIVPENFKVWIPFTPPPPKSFYQVAHKPLLETEVPVEVSVWVTEIHRVDYHGKV